MNTLYFSVVLYFMNITAPVSYILFDLDNTLYHASSPMLKRINILITRYIMNMFSLSFEQAQTFRRQAYHVYGTTLRWLQVEHGFTDVEHYLTYIHPEDASFWIHPDDTIKQTLRSLPQRRSILTNSIREHAERILSYLGIRDEFEEIYDIRFNDLISKPDIRAFTKVLSHLDIPAGKILFMDDNPAFLEPFRQLGGQTALMDHLDVHGEGPYLRVRNMEEFAKKMLPL